MTAVIQITIGLEKSRTKINLNYCKHMKVFNSSISFSSRLSIILVCKYFTIKLFLNVIFILQNNLIDK